MFFIVEAKYLMKLLKRERERIYVWLTVWSQGPWSSLTGKAWRKRHVVESLMSPHQVGERRRLDLIKLSPFLPFIYPGLSSLWDAASHL